MHYKDNRSLFLLHHKQLCILKFLWTETHDLEKGTYAEGSNDLFRSSRGAYPQPNETELSLKRTVIAKPVTASINLGMKDPVSAL